MTHTPSVQGRVDARFESLRDLVAARLASEPEWACQIAAYLHGELVVDLWVAPTYDSDTLQMVYSSTKGLASLCIASLVQVGELEPAAPVVRYWREFGMSGKASITVAQLLSHQAGLIALPHGFALDEYIAGTTLAPRFANAPTSWQPGTSHGYHALTWGPLVEELFRRVTGISIQQYAQAEIIGPFGAEIYFGLPDSEDARVISSANGDLFPRGSWTGIEALALNLGREDFPTLPELEGNPAVRAAGPAAVGAMATARGIAKAYAAAVTGTDALPAFLSEAVTSAVATPQTSGTDLVLGVETSFGLGFQTPTDGLPLLGAGSFGHDGFAGSLACASPAAGLTFGYLTNLIPTPSGGADPFTCELLATLRPGAAEKAVCRGL